MGGFCLSPSFFYNQKAVQQRFIMQKSGFIAFSIVHYYSGILWYTAAGVTLTKPSGNNQFRG